MYELNDDIYVNESLTETEEIAFDCPGCGYISSEIWEFCPNCGWYPIKD